MLEIFMFVSRKSFDQNICNHIFLCCNAPIQQNLFQFFLTPNDDNDDNDDNITIEVYFLLFQLITLFLNKKNNFM